MFRELPADFQSDRERERAQALEQRACQISVVLPCLNEAATITACVLNARAGIAKLGVGGEVIVVDNSSVDASAELAAHAGARIVAAPQHGYGAALRTGIAAARGRYVLIADADATYELGDFSAFWDQLQQGDQLVVGNRFSGGISAGAMPFWNRRLGNPLLSAVARGLFATQLQDFHCGIRAFDREAILSLGLSSNGMEYATEMIAKAAIANLVVSEVPTTLSRSDPSRKSHLRPFRDGLRHLTLMTTIRLAATRSR